MRKVGYFDKDGNPGGKFAGYMIILDPVVQPRSATKKSHTVDEKRELPLKPIFSEIVYMRPHAKAVQVTGVNYYGEYFTYLEE